MDRESLLTYIPRITVRVRGSIIVNARTKHACQYQSCMFILVSGPFIHSPRMHRRYSSEQRGYAKGG